MINKRGFTLAEVIIVVALLGLMLSLSMQILVDSFKNSQVGTVYQDMGDESRLDMEYMTRELYNTSPTHIFPSSGASPAFSEIYFQVPVGFDAAGNIKYGADGIKDYWIDYSFQGGNLIRTLLDVNKNPILTSKKKLSGDVIGLSFDLSAGNAVTVTLTLGKTLSGVPRSQTLSTIVTFRNI